MLRQLSALGYRRSEPRLRTRRMTEHTSPKILFQAQKPAGMLIFPVS